MTRPIVYQHVNDFHALNINSLQIFFNEKKNQYIECYNVSDYLLLSKFDQLDDKIIVLIDNANITNIESSQNIKISNVSNSDVTDISIILDRIQSSFNEKNYNTIESLFFKIGLDETIRRESALIPFSFLYQLLFCENCDIVIFNDGQSIIINNIVYILQTLNTIFTPIIYLTEENVLPEIVLPLPSDFQYKMFHIENQNVSFQDETFQIGEHIKSGSFGAVHHLIGTSCYAIKLVFGNINLGEFAYEMKIYSKLRQIMSEEEQNLLNIPTAFYYNNGTLGFLLNKYDADLWHLQKQKKNEPFKTFFVGERNIETLPIFISSVLKGLYLMQQINIIHADIHQGNVLCRVKDNKIEFAITDFGCSRELGDNIDCGFSLDSNYDFETTQTYSDHFMFAKLIIYILALIDKNMKPMFDLTENITSCIKDFREGNMSQHVTCPVSEQALVTLASGFNEWNPPQEFALVKQVLGMLLAPELHVGNYRNSDISLKDQLIVAKREMSTTFEALLNL